MPDYDFRSPRLYVEAPLVAGESVALEVAPAHYLTHVLRLRSADRVLVFNGQDGEWLGALAASGKKAMRVDLVEQTRSQTPPGDLHYIFAPLKHARLDYMVQKAVEMGASRITPVITRHTQATRVNVGRMRANAIEAAEQCGILTIPQIDEPEKLESLLAGLAADCVLIFCDEAAPVADPLAALAGDAPRPATPLAVLIGPEGGFAPEERAALNARPGVLRLALGPRILRADTAAVAALALVQAALGDWRAT